MRKLVVPILVASMSVLAPSAGHAAGCSVVATGIASGSCTYVATGPGSYEVATLSGFRIEAVRNGQTVVLASRIAAPDQPWGGVWAGGGTLATQAGDRVTIAITVMHVRDQHGNTVLRVQDGMIDAHDN